MSEYVLYVGLYYYITYLDKHKKLSTPSFISNALHTAQGLHTIYTTYNLSPSTVIAGVDVPANSDCAVLRKTENLS